MASRKLLAALLSPLAALLVFWLGAGGIASWVAARPITAGEAAHSLVYAAVVGAPIVYLGAWVLAVPAFVLLERRGRLTRAAVVAWAAALGALWASAAWAAAFGGGARPDTGLLGIAALGALAGAAGGACFCALRGLPPQTPRVAS
ncbi:hypothetical protein [Roseisolibacter agri]|uniref:Uncharacterized protein n=1 Tax=Roseisolibacter agri TaxID=2014610 RepID=A0AA37QF73_9BACT|nr:hypothetical protein [Roseisolibacter agri]GLC24623.1 hypothetical protein rosag_11360 [Roseisolibacter agri]